MKSFEELYKDIQINDKLEEAWEQTTSEEKKTKRITLIMCLILDTVIITLGSKIFFNYMGINIVSIVQFGMIGFIPIFLLDFIIYMVILTNICKSGSEYRDEFKENVIKKLINNFYTDLEYFPEKQMPEIIYKESKNYEKYDNYYSDDYIEAKIDNKYFLQMAEIKTEEEREEKDSDGNTYKSRKTLFNGLFEKITIDKSIGAELKIARNRSYRFNKERIKMDSRRV